jgi:hypothetical protein
MHMIHPLRAGALQFIDKSLSHMDSCTVHTLDARCRTWPCYSAGASQAAHTCLSTPPPGLEPPVSSPAAGGSFDGCAMQRSTRSSISATCFATQLHCAWVLHVVRRCAKRHLCARGRQQPGAGGCTAPRQRRVPQGCQLLHAVPGVSNTHISKDMLMQLVGFIVAP